LHKQPAAEKALLLCGIAYGIAYVVANDVIAATMFPGYSRINQAISELSGTEAPSRAFLNALLPVFTLLLLAFGLGVWRAGASNRALRVTGAALVFHGLLFPVWLLFPMTSRDELAVSGGGINDIGHLVLSGLSLSLILVQMSSSAAALGNAFRYFALAMAITLLGAGGYTATTVAETAAGDPSPWMGLVERIMYGSWLLWISVLAVVLLRREDGRPATL
jgi:hypothetical protein